MVEYPTLLPTRRQICDALTAVVREEKVLRALLKLSVLQEEKRRRTEEISANIRSNASYQPPSG